MAPGGWSTGRPLPRSNQPRILLVLVVALLVLVPTVGTAAPDPAQTLSATQPVTLAGSLRTATTGGAAHLHDPARGFELTLAASHATFVVDWEEGMQGGLPPDQDTYMRATDSGTEVDVREEIQIKIGPRGDPLQLLAYPGDASPNLSAAQSGETTHTLQVPAYLASVYKSPTQTSTGDGPPGFLYETPETWIGGDSYDRATVRGGFSLFVQNATVEASQGDEVVWRNWSGVQTEAAGPASRTYTFHALWIHIRQGQLSMASSNEIELYGPELETMVTGLVSTRSAEGHLQLDGELRRFDGSPMELSGSGGVTLTRGDAGGGGSTAGLELGIGEGSDFTVRGGQHLAPSDQGPIDGGPVAFVASGALILLAAGVLVHRTGVVPRVWAQWRTNRYELWMDRGRQRARERAFSEAARCFEKATRHEPSRGAAWYRLALSQLEADEPATVLETIDAMRDGPAIVDELDVLELETEAARQVGDLDRCREALTALADGSERMARSLVRDLGLDAETLGPELSERLQDDEGGLPGYV